MGSEARFKSIYTSHYAGALRLTLLKNATRGGAAYASATNLTQFDAVQIMNLAYMRYMTLEIDWKGRTSYKMDMLVRSAMIYGAGASKAYLFALKHDISTFF